MATKTPRKARPAAKAGAAGPLGATELARLHAWWRACNYLAVGMIYLRDNPLLRQPLDDRARQAPAARPLGREPCPVLRLDPPQPGDQAGRPGRHLRGRAGPRRAGRAGARLPGGHLLRGLSGPERGPRRACRSSSSSSPFPGHIGSHVTPETPGSIHEGGELGYSLSHAYGAAFDNPDLIVACVIGDGEAETGPLATAWHSNKFLNPARDGAVLPILNLNGYKIANPTILARVSHEELEALFSATATRPISSRAPTRRRCTRRWPPRWTRWSAKIRAIQRKARASRSHAERPRWPMIVLRSPKGWTGPKDRQGPQGRGFLALPPGALLRRAGEPAEPEAAGRLAAELPARGAVRRQRPARCPELRALAPTGARRMSANPHANGGLLRKDLKLPDFRDYAVEVPAARRDAAREHAAARASSCATSCATT